MLFTTLAQYKHGDLATLPMLTRGCLAVLALLAGVCNAETPYNTSGLLPDAEMRVDRGFTNWPLQVSLAARLAAAPGLVVAMQCDWEFWRHRALDVAGDRPVLCLSRHCGRLRVQKAALQPFRPTWAFHCLHAPEEFDTSEADRGAPLQNKPAAAPPAPATDGTRQTDDPQDPPPNGGAAPPPGGNSHPDAPPEDVGPRQALSGLSNLEVDRLIANATVLVVGVPSGGAKLQPPVMAAMARAMPRLAQVDVVVAADRGAQVRALGWGGRAVLCVALLGWGAMY
jgi:hypothetical protein